MPKLWHHVYGLHFPFNEQQTAVFQWHLGYSLKISNPNGKNVKRSAVLKNIARKTYSRDFARIGTQIIFQNLALNQNSRDQPGFQASVLHLIRYSYTSSSFKATYMHMCVNVSIHTVSVTPGYSQWILFLYL